jgi:hypothetical protein
MPKEEPPMTIETQYKAMQDSMALISYALTLYRKHLSTQKFAKFSGEQQPDEPSLPVEKHQMPFAVREEC